jgi:sigma-B regulation protein RsbU (phosphoserine phosphatase)
MSAAGIDIWAIDPDSGEYRHPPRALFASLGYAPEEFPRTTEQELHFLHPDDVGIVEREEAAYFAGERDRFHAEFRVRDKAGNWVWFEAMGELVEQRGERLFMGLTRDITTRKQVQLELARSRERLDLALQAAETDIWETELATGEYISYPERMLRKLGHPEDIRPRVFGDAFHELLHPEDRETTARRYREHVEGRADAFRNEFRVRTADGEWLWFEAIGRIAASGDRMIGITVDVTDRKRAQEETARSEARLRRILETTAQGFLLLDDVDGIVEANPALCELTGYEREELLGLSPAAFVDESVREWVRAQGPDFWLTSRRWESVFIRKDGGRVPVLVYGSPIRDEYGELSGRMAFVIDLTEQKKALELAGEVQRSLLPGVPPRVAGLEVAGCCRPSEEIGGDYFDYLHDGAGEGSELGIVVGDVTGHGVDAALLMTSARAFLRMRLTQPGGPAEVVGALNRQLTRDLYASGRFMTLFYMTIDPMSRRVAWVRAGHDPAIVYDPAADAFHELRGEGMALGLDHDHVYALNEFAGLASGSVVVVGTDGIWEARGEGGFYGRERFREVVQTHAGGGAQAVVDAVLADVRAFHGTDRFEDDLTLVAIRVR